MAKKKLAVQPCRGDHAGGPCAILDCAAVATTAVLWPPSKSGLAEHTNWYCEKDAQEALIRGRARNPRISARP